MSQQGVNSPGQRLALVFQEALPVIGCCMGVNERSFILQCRKKKKSEFYKSKEELASQSLFQPDRRDAPDAPQACRTREGFSNLVFEQKYAGQRAAETWRINTAYL